ncbi:MAG: hypothetical protein LKE30_05670 [Bacteroidales bacterium]|jgi:hypothetical protein|nr:hypothetical protein [Bacteroidales bacterium]
MFQVKKPKKFEYKPRFYDPQKEELEQLKAKYGPITGERYKRKIDFRQAMNDKKVEKISKPISAIRIILFACVVIILVYIVIFVVEKW